MPASRLASWLASGLPARSAPRRRSRLWLAAAVAFLASCSDAAGPSCLVRPEPCTLGELARELGVFAGAAFVQGNDDPEFRRALVRHFNSTTAPVYWELTEPSRGRFDFSVPDEVVELATREGLRVRGHPLVWGRLALPSYVRSAATGGELRGLLRDHLTAVVGRYRGRVRQYDVVNEPLTFLGAGGAAGGLEPYVFLRLLGPGYIREALELVHALDPDAELFVNEFLVLAPGPKQDRFYELVRELVESGAPLLLDESYGLKPAYLGARQALEEVLRGRGGGS